VHWRIEQRDSAAEEQAAGMFAGDDDSSGRTDSHYATIAGNITKIDFSSPPQIQLTPFKMHFSYSLFIRDLLPL